MNRRVLLIDDDPRIRQVLGLALRGEGYTVDVAETAAEGLAALTASSPDVVLLDVMLPDEDGFSVCREIRARSHVPVIMVTARTDSHDVVAGLESGADDYVSKPLMAKELSARIRALLRRAGPRQDEAEEFTVGDLTIRLREAEVLRDDTPLSLTHTEFKLLAELARERGGVCSREVLLQRVWGYDYFGDSRIVDVHVSRLRAKLESDPGQPRHVVTVRGHGYRLVP
ncbi:XRE family transcriptional regulator [Knoellia sinensis KCTC 19936]|uniref:XRE family transcriptional regulator n=1 Tax=Knoellia sinensis KCTC 19936 TaxID=1385520 RepID=A0A0A0JAA7_9MICO|nr:response regulator transcription factor [Knoellia sinensis]KGN32962.1 XRE family transcriptional regulator [Knoellia sinensis KCTC 19936]